MLRVVPRRGSRSPRRRDNDYGGDGDCDFDCSRTGSEPIADSLSARNQEPQNECAGHDPKHDSPDLDPRGDCGEKESDDLCYSAGQRGLDSDRVERGVRCLKRRDRVLRSREATESFADHTVQRNLIQLPRRHTGNVH